MFELLNVYTNNPMVIRISYEKESVDFVISELVNKRKKDELNPEKQFLLLNAYLDWKEKKSPGYKKGLLDLYLVAEKTILQLMLTKDLNPLPYNMVHNIIDYFDYEDLCDYIKNVYKLKPPMVLKDTFDVNMEKNDSGTRVQTYLKDDYLELAALVLILKSVLPVIGHFSFVKKGYISNSHKEYILFNFIKSHPIYNLDPMQKIIGFVDKLLEVAFKQKEASSIRIIEKRVPKDDLGIYIASQLIFNKMSTSILVDDYDGKNTITRMHGYIQSKLNTRNDNINGIRDKQALSDTESGDGDKESIIESYRITTDLPIGIEVEMDTILSSIELILSQFKREVDMVALNDAIKFTEAFRSVPINSIQVNILGTIFKDIIDPRGLDYVSLDSILNLLAIGFAYLYKLGFKYLAVLLTSSSVNTSNDDIIINTTTNRTRLPTEIAEQLAKLYPYERVINATKSVNIVIESIHNLTNSMYVYRWVPNAYEKYLIEAKNEAGSVTSLPADLKTKLCLMYIALEEQRRKL